MLNYILIGIGVLFILLSIASLGMGLDPDEGTSSAGKLGYLIGSLIVAVPFFILGCVLLSVGLLRKSNKNKPNRDKEIQDLKDKVADKEIQDLKDKVEKLEKDKKNED